MLPLFTQGFLLGGTAAAQPGPFQAFLLSLTQRNGFRGSLPAAFAPLISDGPIILLVLLVLSQLPEWGLHGLRIAGGFFLLYLAWGAFKTFRSEAQAEVAEVEPEERGLLKAALMNFLSPAPYIFWSTISGPILIDAWREAPAYGISFLAGFYTALIGGLLLVITLFAGAGRLDPRVSRALSLVSAVALLIFGLYQLGLGAGRLGAAYL